MAGLAPTRDASARTVGSGWPTSSEPVRIAASALVAISRAVEPVISVAGVRALRLILF